MADLDDDWETFKRNIKFGDDVESSADSLSALPSLHISDSSDARDTSSSSSSIQLTPKCSDIYISTTTKIAHLDREIDIKKVLKDWQSNIAYIPQDIFLMNSSIYENITLESEKKNIHHVRLLKAINMAKINNLIKDKGLDMVIGDSGIKISGGQRQRLGIARAIYFNKKILILDESTNSLDQKIKKEILEELSNFDQSYTIIIVDHNIDNFNFFNKILRIENHSIFCKISN